MNALVYFTYLNVYLGPDDEPVEVTGRGEKEIDTLARSLRCSFSLQESDQELDNNPNAPLLPAGWVSVLL